MYIRAKPRLAIELHRVLAHLVLLQLISSIWVACSLSAVLQSAPTATVMSPGASGGQLNKRIGSTISNVRLSSPNLADKISEIGTGLTLTTNKSGFRSNSALLEATSALEPVEPVEPVVNAVAGDTILSRLGSLVKNAIAPTKSYVDLVNRYHKWFRNYKTLQSSSRHYLRDATEVLKEEYAHVDGILLEEEEAKHAAEVDAQAKEGDETTRPPMDPKRAENMDYVFKALRVVIERLEKKLADLEHQEGIEIDEDTVSSSSSTEIEPANNDERIQRAMERVKRTVMKSAKNLLTGEMTIIARTAVLNGLAQYMAAKPDTGDFLDHLRPIISLIGSASTPLAVSYLMSIEFRAALAVVNQANPLSLFGITSRKKVQTA